VFLDTCVGAVLDCMAQQPDVVVLVAHSRNGIVISQAAECWPQKVAGLVYLAAYLVPAGKSMMDYAMTDLDSLVLQNVELALDRKFLALLTRVFRSHYLQRFCAALLPRTLQVHRLARRAYRDALYHDCPAEITELADALLEEEPNWAGFTPLRLTAARYGSVRKVYIECLQDRAVTLALQRRMQADTPCDRVYAIDSGHSPFFSQPAQLVRTLVASLDAFAGIAETAQPLLRKAA
jgi:pimeloyl-ACP methyl ester carboxylesterase